MQTLQHGKTTVRQNQKVIFEKQYCKQQQASSIRLSGVFTCQRMLNQRATLMKYIWLFCFSGTTAWLFASKPCIVYRLQNALSLKVVCSNIRDSNHLFNELKLLTYHNIYEIEIKNSNQLRKLDGSIFMSLPSLQKIKITKTNLESSGKHVFETKRGELRVLELQKNNMSVFPKFETSDAYSRRFDRLKHLDVSFNRLKAIEESSLANLRSLTILKANNNEIHHIGSKAFVNNPHLIEIDLSFNHLSVLNNEAFKLNTGYNQYLTAINLTSNKIAFPDLGNGKPAFETALRFLDLRGNYLSSFPEQHFSTLLNNMADIQYNYIYEGKVYLTCTKDVNRCNLDWLKNTWRLFHLIEFEGNRCNAKC